MPWMSGSIDENPSWVRDTLLAKVSAERRAEKYLYERAKRESRTNKGSRR